MSAATACGRRAWASNRLLAGGWNVQRPVEPVQHRRRAAAQRRAAHAGRPCVWAGSATATALTLLLNSVDQPAQDPLGLTRDAVRRRPVPDHAAGVAVRHAQDQRPDPGRRHLAAPLRRRRRAARKCADPVRRAAQRHAVAVDPGGHAANPRQRGGVIDFDRDFSGVDARLVWRWAQASLIAGVNSERQGEDRRGYENFIGSGAEPGARRDRRVAPRRDQQPALERRLCRRARSN